MTPLVADIIARAGYSKTEVKRYLFEHARVSARELDERLERNQPGVGLPCDQVKQAVESGRLPEIFALSEDPGRLVPVVHKPEEFQIVVSGSPSRNRSFVAGQFGNQGLSVSKPIRLPTKS